MQDHTILGEDIRFRGKLTFDDSVTINGTFKGTVVTGGSLTIGSGAEVEADIETGTLHLNGDLRGNVVATRRTALSSTSKMKGDIRSPELEVEPGAKFTGSCIMDQ